MAKLGEIFDLQMGKTPSRNNEAYWNDGKHNWISIADLGTYHKYTGTTKEMITELAVQESGIKKVPKNTVIMSFKLSLGKTAITSEEIYTNEAIMAFIPKKEQEISPDYFYYLFSGKDWSKSTNRAVMGTTLNKATLSEIDVEVPSLETQHSIVEKMDLLYKVIELRKKQLDKHDELVKSRFIEMFGDPGSDNFGWGLIPLGEVCQINPKKNHDNRLHDGLVVSFVPMSAISEDGQINASETKSYEEVRKGFTYFAENDVLFAKITPCMENGKGAVAKGLVNQIGFGSTEFHVIRPIEGQTNSIWVYELTVLKNFRMDAFDNMTGSAGQKRVPASFLENYKVSLPPLDLQNQFADFVAQVDKSKLAVQKSLEQLEILKKALMQEYFG